MSALAFFRNPTGAVGVLTAGDYAPLTLHGTRVTVSVRHGVPTVVVGYEYRNQTSSSQSVFASFSVPSGWRLLSARADASMGNNFVRTQSPSDSLTVAPLVSMGFATLQVPWSIMVGQYVVVQATFLAPPIGTSFTLPSSLFPKKLAQSSTASGWRGAFAIQAPFKFEEGCVVSIEGTVGFPLSGLPELNKGLVGVNGTLLGDPKGFRLQATINDDAMLSKGLTVRFPFKSESVSELQMQLATVLESNRDVVSAENAYAIVTTLNPSFTDLHHREPNSEFIFVLGLGNGITDESISSVREALHAAFAGLPASCSVNAVCCVGSDATSDIWMDGTVSSLPVSSDLLGPFGAATTFLKNISSFAHSETKSGVVVQSAMKRPAALVQDIIATKPFVRGLARNIVLITTDGGDSQAELTCQRVVANRHSTSVSAVSLAFLGAADVAFLASLTAAGNGQLVVCNSPDSVVESVLGLVGALAVPALTQVNIHYADSNSPSTDGSSASSVVHCGMAQRNIPFVRYGSDAQWLYAFANASIGQLTVKVEGLIGSESLQYVVKTPKDAVASTEQSSCAKGNAVSLSPAHLAAAALRQDQLIVEAGADARDKLLSLTRQFSIPTHRSYFPVVDESGVVADDLMVSSAPNPLRNFILGRKGALPPNQQSSAVTVVSTSSSPYSNVAVDTTLKGRLIHFGEAERQAQQAKAQRAFDDRKRREKAIGIDDQEAADAVYANEQLQIDSIRNPAAEYLGGGVSLTGGSSAPQTMSSSDYFRILIEQLVGAICEPMNVNKILQSQQLDGSMSAESGFTLASVGVTSEVLSHIPSAIANKGRAGDLWLTIIALARVQNDPRSVLFQRKARSFLLSSGVEPDQHEAHAQHVLASSS